MFGRSAPVLARAALASSQLPCPNAATRTACSAAARIAAGVMVGRVAKVPRSDGWAYHSGRLRRSPSPGVRPARPDEEPEDGEGSEAPTTVHRDLAGVGPGP